MNFGRWQHFFWFFVRFLKNSVIFEVCLFVFGTLRATRKYEKIGIFALSYFRNENIVSCDVSESELKFDWNNCNSLIIAEKSCGLHFFIFSMALSISGAFRFVWTELQKFGPFYFIFEKSKAKFSSFFSEINNFSRFLKLKLISVYVFKKQLMNFSKKIWKIK